MEKGGHAHHTGTNVPDDMPPMEHDCAMMAACAPAAPAIMPTFGLTVAFVTHRTTSLLAPEATPPNALRAPPFHPPKA